jgi:protein-S-isoprenylcysteine O-methyltransferase Ste14
MSRYPLFLMIVMLGLVWWAGSLFPSTLCLGPAGKGVGWFVAICGISLLVIAAGLFRKEGTTVNPTREPTKLVTDGIYRMTRNPMYLGMLMILSGFALILESPIGLVFPVIFFFLMDRLVIPREEKVVEGVFGETYRVYKSSTRRWI